MTERYQIQVFRDPLDESTAYRITDSTTDSRVATCYVETNARLVRDALNRLVGDPALSAKDRAAFERWLAERHQLESVWNEQRRCYEDFPAHLAWCAWRDAREAKPYCVACNQVGLRHCSDPENCGNVVWPVTTLVPDQIFDGYSVFTELQNDPHARERTTHENVQDVLNAILRFKQIKLPEESDDVQALRKRHSMNLPWARSDTQILLNEIDRLKRAQVRAAIDDDSAVAVLRTVLAALEAADKETDRDQRWVTFLLKISFIQIQAVCERASETHKPGCAVTRYSRVREHIVCDCK